MNKKRVVGGLAAVAALVALGLVVQIGPRNVIGMLRYDTRREGALKVGDRAPAVDLLALDGTTRVPLTGPPGQKQGRPLVLIFGSFTWPPFRRSVERLQTIYRRYRAQADFLTVYIREAHPTDEWQMPSNQTESICYRQPRSTADRVAIANDFVSRFHYELPLQVDTIDNPADRLYAGWPERFYIIAADGTIAYKGQTGPFGFHPEEVEAWLKAHFPDGASPTPWAAAAGAA